VSWSLERLQAQKAMTPSATASAETMPTRDRQAVSGSSPTADQAKGSGPLGGDVGERTSLRYLAVSGLACVILFAIVWLYMLALPMAFLSRDYPQWLAKRSLLASCDVGSVSIFGDSRALVAIDPMQLPFKASNFAFSGTTPIEGYFTVQRMLRCPKLPKAVVIGFSPGPFMQDVYYWDVSVRSGILNFSNTRQVQKEGESLHDREISVLRQGDELPPLVREALYAARFPSIYFSSLVNSYVFGRYVPNLTAEDKTLASRGHAFMGEASGSDALAGEAYLPNFAASPLIDAYFTHTLSALSNAKIPVVIVSFPVNEATCRSTTPELRAGFTQYLTRRVAAFPDARIVGPLLPCWPDRLFGDATHLNASGAAAYTKLVAHWLLMEMPQLAESAQIVER
jgi:hypothetical protein